MEIKGVLGLKTVFGAIDILFFNRKNKRCLGNWTRAIRRLIGSELIPARGTYSVAVRM